MIKNVMLHLISDYLDLRNAVVPFMVFSTPHDADTNAVALHKTNTNLNGIM